MPAKGHMPRPARRARQGATRAPLACALAGIALFPSVGAAFDLPEGCTAFLTVQSKGCSVSVLWTCDAAPAGDFSEASFGPDGLESLVSYDANYQWLDTVYTWDSSREEFLPPATDPIELPSLIATGIDTYDFTMRRSEPDKRYDIRVVGADELTGKTAVIDGHTLDILHTRLEIIAEDGTVEYRSEGLQYLSRELGHFFLGAETVWGEDGAANDYDSSPVDIIHPGEPGFGSTTPLYECIGTDAAFTAPLRPTPDTLSAKEIDDDQV